MHTPTPAGSASAHRVRWGILATGGVAHLFVKDLVAHGHVVQAVGSRSVTSAESFASKYGIPAAYGSYEELAKAPDVDVIYVATPHNSHAANAALALTHGKHVLVEKSFTMTETEARAVTSLAQERGLLVMEAMWTRFLPHMAFVRDVVRSGRLGRVRSLHAEHAQRLPDSPTHRLNDPLQAGGALLDLGIYPISFAHDLLGAPEHVLARATYKPTGVDGSVATILQHPGGAISTSYSSSETLGTNTATVLGTDGRIELASIWYTASRVTLYDSAGTVLEVFDQPVSGRGMQFQAEEVERLIAAGGIASSVMPPDESVRVMATMDAIRSAIGLRYPDECCRFPDPFRRGLAG